MVTKKWEFLHKNGYKSGNIRDTADNLAPTRGFSRSGNLMVSMEFSPYGPLLPW